MVDEIVRDRDGRQKGSVEVGPMTLTNRGRRRVTVCIDRTGPPPPPQSIRLRGPGRKNPLGKTLGCRRRRPEYGFEYTGPFSFLF